HMKIGIDAGGTLLKIVYVNGGHRHFEKRPSSHIDQLIDELNSHHSQDQIYLTGGKAEYMSENLNQNAGISVEFDATYSGLMSLIKEQGLGLKRFVYLNV